MRSFIRKFFALIYLTEDILYSIRNRLVFYSQSVIYEEFPDISGKVFVVNKGICTIGRGVKFRSTTRSNFVGICKPCSMFISAGASLQIGKNSGFSGISIFCANSISIGDFVNCGGNVYVWDTDFHPLDHSQRRVHEVTAIKTEPVHIGNDVFIGANSMILKGVSIGDKAIVGAGSVVTCNIPAGEIWAGNPAKYIRTL